MKIACNAGANEYPDNVNQIIRKKKKNYPWLIHYELLSRTMVSSELMWMNILSWEIIVWVDSLCKPFLVDTQYKGKPFQYAKKVSNQ